MPHILLIWELGEDLGHLARLSKSAEEFIRRGHRVTVAVKDLSRADFFFGNSQARLLQSPIWLPQLKRPRLTKTLADILAYKGYGDVEGLSALVKAWRTLLADTRPDLIIFDYAPTALLAARDLSQPKVVVSNSYSFPVPGIGAQDICPWISAPIEAMRRNENHIVDNVNQVARRLALPEIRHISDIYEHDAAFNADVPFFDIFASERKGAVYVGPPSSNSDFPECDWGEGQGKRVFVYLKPGRPHVDVTLRALAKSGAIVRGYFAGSLSPDLKDLQSPSFQLSSKPFDIEKSLADADSVVMHGGIGTVCNAVFAGLPMFCLPTQIEQIFNSRKVAEYGVGNWVGREDTDDRVEEKLGAFLVNAEYGRKAKVFAQEFDEYRGMIFEKVIVNHCEKLLE